MFQQILITPSHKDVKPCGFYVYVHRRATDGSAFYVGKGSGTRGWHKAPQNRGKWWFRTALKNGVIIEVAQDGMTEEDSFLLEMWLIAKFRHEGEKLVNIGWGGSGITTGGHRYKTRMSISKSRGGKKVYCSNGMEFEAPCKAKEWLKSIGHFKAQGGGVTSCCRGIVKSYLGYSWSYHKAPKHPEKFGQEYGRKPVLRSDGHKYDSIEHAVEDIKRSGYPKASGSKITMCCKGKRKTAYGYMWSYTN